MSDRLSARRIVHKIHKDLYRKFDTEWITHRLCVTVFKRKRISMDNALCSTRICISFEPYESTIVVLYLIAFKTAFVLPTVWSQTIGLQTLQLKILKNIEESQKFLWNFVSRSPSSIDSNRKKTQLNYKKSLFGLSRRDSTFSD